jgi:hypothetical protein
MIPNGKIRSIISNASLLLPVVMSQTNALTGVVLLKPGVGYYTGRTEANDRCPTETTSTCSFSLLRLPSQSAK